MADQNTAAPGADETTEQDPFAGFESESYEHGERVDDAAPAASDEEEVPANDEAGEGEEGAPADDDAGEGDGEGGDEGDDEGEGKDTAPKPKKTAQERINELTRARREAERRAEALERELQATRTPPEPGQKPTEPAAKPNDSAAPDKSKAPNPDDFDYGEIDPKYIAALVDYQTTQRLNEYQQTQEQRQAEQRAAQEQAAAREKFEQQIKAGSTKHEDFVEKVVVGAEKGAWLLSETMGKMLVESDVGDDIAYHLASNPEEAASVYRQAPMEQARYFGRLEAKFSAEQSAAPGTPPAGNKAAPPRAPKAPAPVLPARGAGGNFQASASTDDFAAFERRASQEK